jgi:putative hydrolase
MIRNDLHVHSIQSACGLHTLLELASIAAAKGMRGFNLSDHGPASGRSMNFGVLADTRRLPETMERHGASVRIWRGIEANLLTLSGDTDIPADNARFDLISLGLHGSFQLAGQFDQARNTEALLTAMARHPVDMLCHPCIRAHPLDVDAVVERAAQLGVLLEINNTNLRLGKTDVAALERMILRARELGAALVETSDAHVYTELGENEQVEAVLSRLDLVGDEVLLNRDDQALDRRIAARKAMRA